MGIGACGHQAIEKGMLLKVFTSCLPNQKATACAFILGEGIHFDDDGLFCYLNKDLSGSQTTYGCDFTQIKCLQTKGHKARCRLPDVPVGCLWKWKDIVTIGFENSPSFCIKLIRNRELVGDAWHYVFVKKELLEIFDQVVATGSVDVGEFGFVIEQGYGKDPPDDLVEKMRKYSPKYW